MKTVDPDEFDSRPAHRRVGTYLIGIVVIGIAASIMVFVVAMQSMGWPAALLGGARTPVLAKQQSTVALYVSPQTRTFFNSAGGNYDTLLAPWRKYFAEVKIRPNELTSAQEIADLKPSTLVLPSAVALSNDERRELLAFRDRGGSILVTWATGTRGGAGEWVGGDFLTSLANVVFAGEIAKEAEVGHLVLSGNSPVSFSQGAGKRVWLGYTAERPLRLKSATTGARFLNWSRIPQAERMDEAAVAFFEAANSAGRVVVFGFSESGWEQQTADIHQLVNDCLSWLRHQPTLVKAAWPFARQSAQIIEMDTEQGFTNAPGLLKLLKGLDYKGAFYVLTSSGAEFPDTLKDLAQNAEVGYHGDVHVSFKDQAPDIQSQRITSMLAQMKSVLPDTQAITGFRAPNEGYDKTTEILLQKAGIRHHIAGPADAETCQPLFAPIEGTTLSNGLLRLSRAQRDDLNLLKETTDPATLSQSMVNDFEIARGLSCLGILSVHSQNMGEGQLFAQAFPAYIDHLKKHGNTVWLASPQAVDAWWRDRERLRLAVRGDGTRFEFDVSVGGDRAVQGGSLLMMLPKKGSLPTISGVKPGMPQPKITAIDDFRAAIVFEKLEPGNYFYQASF